MGCDGSCGSLHKMHWERREVLNFACGEHVRGGQQGSLIAIVFSRLSEILPAGRMHFGRSSCDSSVMWKHSASRKSQNFRCLVWRAHLRGGGVGGAPILKGPACSFPHWDFQSQEGSCH